MDNVDEELMEAIRHYLRSGGTKADLEHLVAAVEARRPSIKPEQVRNAVALEELVRTACESHGLDFRSIKEVKLNDDEHPTQITVSFQGHTSNLVIEISYPPEVPTNGL